jgi:tetratricopeptide (TPR) repeat protein
MARPKAIDDTSSHPEEMLAPPTESHSARNFWLRALVLVVATFVAYQSVWRAGFVWDDDDHLTANPVMSAPRGWQMIWSSLAASRYYPLTLTSFWAERQLWGLNPVPYHLVNIALHAINGVLLFFLLDRLRVPAAWLAAMLWALHPVNVESVAWITELKNTQSGAFFFLAMMCFLRFETHKHWRWYLLALLCALAAVLSKPSTVVLPLVLLLCVWWQRGRWQRADVAQIVPFFGLAFGMSVLTVIEQRGHILKAGITAWKLGVGERFIVGGKAVVFYAAKLLWPVKLAFVYPHWELRTTSFLSWLPLAGVVAGGALLWVWRRRSWARAGLFGLGCFVAGLLPVLGFFDVYYFRYSFVADHFQYLASVALIALLASVATRICESAGRVGCHIGTVMGAATLIALGALTWSQAGAYRDVETLWRDTLAKNPDCWMAHNNLGDVLYKSGRVQEAAEHYEQALRINPELAEAHYNLGNVLSREGRTEQAIRHYEQALRIRPHYAEAQNNWGEALQQMGKPADAIVHYEQALRIEPGLAGAHNNLGNALYQIGNMQKAIYHYEQALRINPDVAETHNNLGTVLSQVGRMQDAIRHYEQALRIKPDYAEAHSNLGGALQQAGRLDDAIRHYTEALRIDPNVAAVHYNLGNVLLQAGRTDEAIGHYERALRINPNLTAVHYNLGNALFQAGRPEDAIRHYELVLKTNPDLAAAHYSLANAFFQTGRLEDAIRHYEEALRTDPRDVDAWFNLGLVLTQAGRAREAVRCYEQAVLIKPEYIKAQDKLARLLAMLPPTMGGDAIRAVTVAEQACKLTGNGVTAYVDTLAIAYAAAGRFNDAIATAQKAIALARTARQPQWVKEIEGRLELYRNGRTYSQLVGSSGSDNP